MSKLVQRYPVLGSSQNPEALSLTVKGILIALVPVIIALGKGFGLDILEADLVNLINQLATIIAAGAVIWGLARKIIKK
jgi:hypothetical protein